MKCVRGCVEFREAGVGGWEVECIAARRKASSVAGGRGAALGRSYGNLPDIVVCVCDSVHIHFAV